MLYKKLTQQKKQAKQEGRTHFEVKLRKTQSILIILLEIVVGGRAKRLKGVVRGVAHERYGGRDDFPQFCSSRRFHNDGLTGFQFEIRLRIKMWLAHPFKFDC